MNICLVAYVCIYFSNFQSDILNEKISAPMLLADSSQDPDPLSIDFSLFICTPCSRFTVFSVQGAGSVE